MAIDAYILPFPDGVMGFVDADPARLPVRGGRVTLALYGPAEATAADQAALRSRFIEAVGSSIRSEGGYAAVFWPRLWWTVGGLLSLLFLVLVALPSGLSVIWLTLLAAVLALAAALLAIAGMMAWLRRATFAPFAVYRILLGGLLLYLIHVEGMALELQ